MKRDLAIRALDMAGQWIMPLWNVTRSLGPMAFTGSIFKTLMAELIWRNTWTTRRQTEMALFEYINGFYNPRRRHSTLGGKNPLAFERKAA